MVVGWVELVGDIRDLRGPGSEQRADARGLLLLHGEIGKAEQFRRRFAAEWRRAELPLGYGT